MGLMGKFSSGRLSLVSLELQQASAYYLVILVFFSKHFEPSDFKDGKFDGTLKIDAVPQWVTFDFGFSLVAFKFNPIWLTAINCIHIQTL